ncbi:MAG TPA: type II toxin-antitoxin system RelE/ParE family toxin [Bacteroidales bacterium]|nr:type II toxin-antitoxin system RelE/ParE family toxin [Bacteroidales bacterium]
MKTEFLKQFEKDLDKLVLQSIKSDVADVIENTENAAKITDIKGLKKLSGYKFAYRIRIGDYRIGVFIEKNIVEFARIAHRKDIYKVFP